MSYYYNYYIGYQKDGKIYPLGPYNCFGKLKTVISRSRSFASDLHNLFYHMKEEAISDELRKEFEYPDWKGNPCIDVKFLPMKELPSGSCIKRGYFLMEDVKEYESNEDAWDIFYDHLSPEVYAAKLQNELAMGKPTPEYDEEGEEIVNHSAADYMYYAYQDYNCQEYEAECIRLVADMLSEYEDIPEGAELVVLETEG